MLSMVASSTGGLDGPGEDFNGGDAAETPFAGRDFSHGGEIARGFGLGERVEEGLEIGRVLARDQHPRVGQLSWIDDLRHGLQCIASDSDG
jgi:hypothetical protein